MVLIGGATHFTKASDLKPLCDKIPQHHALTHLFVIIIVRNDESGSRSCCDPTATAFLFYFFRCGDIVGRDSAPSCYPKISRSNILKCFFGVGRRQWPAIIQACGGAAEAGCLEGESGGSRATTTWGGEKKKRKNQEPDLDSPGRRPHISTRLASHLRSRGERNGHTKNPTIFGHISPFL